MFRFFFKQSLTIAFSISILLSSSINALSFHVLQNASDPRLSKIKTIYVNSFKKAYKKIYPDVEITGNEVFTDYKKLLQGQNKKFVLIVAQENENPVGFISLKIEQLNKKEVLYIDQLAVNPTMWRQGIAKKILAKSEQIVLNEFPKISKTTLITRRKNHPAINFYKKIGFTECSYMHEGYDPKVYIGLEKYKV